jgi:arylsulfatase A
MHLTAKETTIATLLKDAGYDTCHVGKWHLSKLNSDQPQPKDHGFDYSLGTSNNAEPSHKDPINFIRNGVEVGSVKGFSCQIVTDEAIQWLSNRKAADKPFFLYVAFHEPHKRLASPPEMQRQYPHASEKDKLYLANIQNLDNAAGKLLAALERMNLQENTFVFFTSDNGPWRQGSQGNLRGKKAAVYEGGIREPGIIRWPGKVKPDTVNNQPVHATDFLPTVCSIAGIQPPKDRTIDGEDLSTMLKGKSWKRSKPLYWYFYRAKPQAALREGDWVMIAYQKHHTMPKTNRLVQQDIDFIKNAQWEKFELYNIVEDPSQQHDLATKNPQHLNSMKKILTDLHKEIIEDVPHWPWK